jgi:hypothetical protein
VNKNMSKTEDEISKIFNDVDVVKTAMQAGINAALLKHKKMGESICVWRDGKVLWIAPEDIKINQKLE